MPKSKQTGNKGGKKAKKKRITKAGVDRGQKHAYATLHTQYTGYHSAVIQNLVKKKVTERASQFLTHLATALKAWYAEVSNASEIEIQIAVVNDRIVISSNKDVTATYMYNAFVETTAQKFVKRLETYAEHAIKRAERSDAVEADRIKRQSGKLKKELTGKRVVGLHALQNLINEGKDICVQFDATQNIGESFAHFLNGTGTMADKYVAVMTSTAYEMHAEQKTLVALCKAGQHIDRTWAVTFAGTFRPCRGCYESLKVVQKYAFPNLQFGARPGHFWMTTTRAHMELITLLQGLGCLSQAQIETDFDDNGLLIGLTNTTYRPVLRTRGGGDRQDYHYATDSESEDESEDD